MVDQGPAEFPLVHLEPGYRLERYELLAPYARGGMASVWLGRVTGKHGFQRVVAVKTILPDYAADPDFRTMLLDEARIASAVEHPNVAQTLDVGEENGVVYLVLEWIDGDSLYTLHRMLDKTRKELLPVGVTLRTMADACRGLHAAHELRDRSGAPLGVVHRDLSPHNVLLNSQGVAKLIDFGVAKAQGRFGGQTSAGIIKGKVRFMSPEQAVGREVDRRADIWSAGATLQYLLTGTHPYGGSNDVEVLLAITRGEPPAPLPATVHPAIADVVARALAPDPAKRYPTAAALARALEVAAEASGNRTTNADVAEFLQTAGRPLQERRTRALDLALKAAEGRAKYDEALQPLASPGSSKHSGQRARVERPPTSEPSVPAIAPASGTVPLTGTGPRRISAAAIEVGAGVPDDVSTVPVVEEGDKTSPNLSPPAKRSPRMAIVATCATLAAAAVTAVVLAVVSHSSDQGPTTTRSTTAPIASAVPPPVAAPAETDTQPAPAPISIEDLPVASAPSAVAATPPAARPGTWSPPRPTAAAPPPARPTAPTSTAGDRQRNFGF